MKFPGDRIQLTKTKLLKLQLSEVYMFRTLFSRQKWKYRGDIKICNGIETVSTRLD